jgi:hypothetical protein
MNSLDSRKARLIAFYLPQFHPIPENDEWWGRGFTEWVTVAQARPLFRGHYQPRIPADLGFYNLCFPEVRFAQAKMAREYGIEGFCYWHYWFAGRRILERPFQEVLRLGEPDFPFCLGWANHSWFGKWYGGRKDLQNQVLIEQTYPGLEDAKNHFYCLLEAFADERYITVEGKPLLFIYRPQQIPDAKRVTDCWRGLAVKAGLKGLHLVGQNLHPSDVERCGFDATSYSFRPPLIKGLLQENLLGGWMRLWEVRRLLKVRKLVTMQKLFRKPLVYPYKEVLSFLLKKGPVAINDYPTLIPNWDNTPRALYEGLVFHESTPELFRLHLQQAVQIVVSKPMEWRIIFIRSWNEWSEGNYLEPDRRYGRAFLEMIRDEIGTNVSASCA